VWRAGTLLPTTLLASEGTQRPAQRFDLSRNGQSGSLILSEGRAWITEGRAVLWSSPGDWEVTHAQITDLNQDGRPEATLLVWRDFKVWPIDDYLPHGGRIEGFQDRHGRSCHLILIGWRDGAFVELWAGSALADPLHAFVAVDLEGNGTQELVALEGRYDAPRSGTHTLTLWEWNGFGFTLRARGPSGRFHQLVRVQGQGGRDLLLVQGTLRR
jgi:hypothetical protein